MNSITVGNLKALLSLDTTNFDKGVTTSEANAKKLAKTLEKDLAPSQARINSLIRDFAGNADIRRALEMATAVEKIGGASKLTANEQIKANRVAQEALDKYRALGLAAPPAINNLAIATTQLKKNTDQLGQSLATVSPQMNKVGMSATDLLGKAKSLAGVFGVSVGVGAVAGFASSVINAADHIGDLATKMSVSTDAAQRFQFAARQVGLEVDDVSKAVTHLNAGIGEGKSSGVAKALGAMGLEFEKIKNLNPEELFRTTIKTISEIKNPMEQAAAAAAAFGDKLGAQLLPLIREGALDAADGINIMSAETIKRLKDAKQAWENFGNSVTAVAGDMFADVLKGMDLFLNDWQAAWESAQRIGIMGLAINPRDALNLINADVKARRDLKKPLPFFSDLPNQLTEVGAYGGMFGGMTAQNLPGGRLGDAHFDTEWAKKQEAEEKRLKAMADAAEQAEKAYRAFERQRISGFTDAERQKQEFELRFLRERNLLDAMYWGRGIVSKSPLSSLLGPGIDLGYTPPIPSMALPMTPPKARGPISLQELLTSTGFTMPGYNKRDLFGQGFSGAMGNLSQTILQAFQGGGDVGKSIGSLFGGQIGTSLMGTSTKGVFESGFGKMLQESFLGKKVGGMVASFIPGIGALLGPALGKLFSSIGNIGANNTKKDRESFAKESGFESLDNLYSKLRSLGTEGEKLANIGLNVIGKKDRAANEKWMKDVTAFFDRLEKVPGKVNELSQALGKFGGAIPKQLDPLLDSILADKNLDPALRRQLEGMRKPSWQAAQDFASSVGINLGALGPGFNQSRLADQAFSLKRGIDLLSRFAGSDQNAILRDMADEFSALAQDAKKNNVALPRAVQAFLRQIDEMGLLLDENGDRLDLSLLQFADIEDESMKEVVSLLEQIRDLLSPRPAPTPGAPGGPGGPPRPAPPTDPDNPDPGDPYDPRGPIRQPDLSGFGALSLPDIGDMPGFGGFGGTGQAVTAAGANVSIYAIDAASFETFMSQRGGAEVVVRTMGPVIERWGKAQ
jgi:hypothetical protein